MQNARGLMSPEEQAYVFGNLLELMEACLKTL